MFNLCAGRTRGQPDWLIGHNTSSFRDECANYGSIGLLLTTRLVMSTCYSNRDDETLFTAAPFLILNRNESEVRDRHKSLQWVPLLNVFFGLFCRRNAAKINIREKKERKKKHHTI